MTPPETLPETLLAALTGARHGQPVLTLGSAVSPQPAAPAPVAPVAIAVLAPTAGECRQSGWLDAAVDQAAAQTAPDGMIYVLAPRRWRAALARRLAARGLTPGAPIVHARGGASDYCLPLDSRVLAYVLRTWSLPRRWRALVRLLGAMPCLRRPLAVLLPRVGIPAFRAPRRPFGWFGMDNSADAPARALVVTSWRGAAGGAVVLGFSAGMDTPAIVAKRPPATADPRRADEARLLAALGPAARAAGIAVPRPIGTCPGAGWLVQSAMSGTPLAAQLATGRAKPAPTIAALAAWLARWNVQTATTAPLDRALLERHLYEPALRLAPELPDSAAYLRRLERLGSGLDGSAATFVASHNDLTMANVLRAPTDELAVVDWETAEPAGLPLADFWYAAVDVVAAGDGYADRARAFAECFAPAGRYHALVARHSADIAGALHVDRRWLHACFHACWLRHAANEQTAARPGAARPFLAIARALGPALSLAPA